MRRATTAPLVFGAAVVAAAEFIVIGLIPAMTVELRLAPTQSGSLITVFALASALFGPGLVAATARFPVGPVLAAALLPFAANLLLLALPSFPVAIALRVLQGAALPLFMSLAAAALGSERGTGPGIALVYIGVTIGGTLAPPAGSFMAEYLGWQGSLAVIGALSLVGAAACLMGFSSTKRERSTAPWRLLTRPALQRHLILSTLTFAAMFSSFSYFGQLLTRTGFGDRSISLALLVFGIAGLSGNWLAGKLAARALLATVAAAMLAATMAMSVVYGIGPFATVLALLIWGAAHAAAFVFCQIRVMTAAPDSADFSGSLNISAANIGIALGSFAGGKAIELVGVTGAAFAGWIFAMLAVGVSVTCRNVARPPQTESSQQRCCDVTPQ